MIIKVWLESKYRLLSVFRIKLYKSRHKKLKHESVFWKSRESCIYEVEGGVINSNISIQLLWNYGIFFYMEKKRKSKTIEILIFRIKWRATWILLRI